CANDGDDAGVARGGIPRTDETGRVFASADDHRRGVLHGVPGSSGLAASCTHRIWHATDCGWVSGAESLYRTRIGSIYAADGFAAIAQRLAAAEGSAFLWDCAGDCRCGGFVDFQRVASIGARGNHLLELFAGVHAT